MDKVFKLKQIEGDSLSGKKKPCQRSASTPRAGNSKPSVTANVLDTSAISNISCSEKVEQDDADTTVTNVTVVEVSSDVSFSASKLEGEPDKENVKPSKQKVSKKRKRNVVKLVTNDDSSDDDNTIVFVENPKKAIQMNQSISEEYHRLGSNEQEIAVGIFWDIENVRMPKGVNPAVLITKLRKKFVDESSKFCEKHFYVVCDVKEESYQIMKQLFEFHVRIIHVPRLKANSSDNVIRDLMHEFVGYNKYCRIILISGDCDFSHDIHKFRRNKKCDCILVYNKNTKDSMIRSASSAYLYTDLIKEEQEGKKGIFQRNPHLNEQGGSADNKAKKAQEDKKGQISGNRGYTSLQQKNQRFIQRQGQDWFNRRTVHVTPQVRYKQPQVQVNLRNPFRAQVRPNYPVQNKNYQTVQNNLFLQRNWFGHNSNGQFRW
jgi:hypothetical protein